MFDRMKKFTRYIMKKLCYLLLFMFPAVAFSQQPWYNYSPTDYAWKNVGDAGFSQCGVAFVSLAFNPTNGTPYVAFQDEITGQKATVMKFDGTHWVNVGNADFTAGEADDISLAFDPSGDPCISFVDCANSYKATVMKFDGVNWVTIGPVGFSAGYVGSTSLAFSPSGQPYVGYADAGYSLSITVMKYDGNNWINVGNPGFSAGRSFDSRLVFSPSGQPYIAYVDFTSNKVTVMKFDGTWETVGNVGFSAGEADYLSFAINNSGVPYVSYSDFENYPSQEITVMKFDGMNWVNVGNPGFSGGGTAYTSLAFSPSDGEPYVAFVDLAHAQHATVMKFNGTEWVTVGNTGFSAQKASYPSLAFSPTGQPYVAYGDYQFSYSRATVMKYDTVSVGINEQQESRIKLYPNPATEYVTIATPLKSQLTISNINGQQFISLQTTKPDTQLDISSLPSGVYIVRVTSEKSVALRKFIKQ